MYILNWEPEAGLAYKNIGHQPAGLKSAVERVLDILEADPTNRLVRPKSLRTKTGYAIWKVPIRESLEDWSLLWIADPEDTNAVLILYLGPASYGENL